jgi:hypothetical protein
MAHQTKKTRARRRHFTECPDSGDAFVPDVARSHERLPDDVSESLAEEFIATVTSAESVGEDARDEMTTEDYGGPLLELAAVTPPLELDEPDEMLAETR